MLTLAWRNLWRHKRRTLLLSIVVAYATLAIVFFWSFTDGFIDSITANQARYVSAPGLITTPAYHRDPDPENALPTLDFVNALSAPGLRGVAPRLEFPALLRSPYTSSGALIRGVDPGLEPAVSNIPASIGEGRMLEAPGELVLGRTLAAELDVRVGERLAVDVSSLAGPQAAGLTVVGLIDAGMTIIDQGSVLVHIADARSLTGVATATGVALDIPFGQEARVTSQLQPQLPEGITAYPLSELMGTLAQGLAGERLQTLPLGLIFSLFAAITVTSTLVVSVLERTREFGIMIALGLSQQKLALLVILEAIYSTLIGFVVGLALGYGLSWVLHVWNILGPFFAGVYGDVLSAFALSDEIYTRLSAEYLIYASFTIILAVIFAALTPARRVLRLNPSQAMRTE
jgi:ABC-type lipoprotein release transport system permease subunit